MATYQIVAWKGIPAVVEARDGTETVTRELSDRFQALIDSVAVQLGLQDSEAYLEQWNHDDWREADGSPDEVAGRVAAELDQGHPQERLEEMLDG